MPGLYQYNTIPFYDMLSGLGDTLSNSIEKRKVKDTLASLPPEASWNDRASAILSADPTLAVAMGRTDVAGNVRNQPRPASEYEQYRIRADQEKLNEKHAATRASNSYFADQAGAAADAADSLTKQPGLEAATGGWKPNTGIPALDAAAGYIPAEPIPNKPGGAAANFVAAKEALKAKIGFAELNAMRAHSKTGGALGQVAVQEIDFLQNSIASLDAIQDPKVFRQRVG